VDDPPPAGRQLHVEIKAQNTIRDHSADFEKDIFFHVQDGFTNLRWYLIGLEYTDAAALQRDLQVLRTRFLRLCDPGSPVASALGEQTAESLREILERDFDLIVRVGLP
jgi:hypothetical protein